MDLSQVLLKPVITEKSLAQAAQGRYTFFVHPQASKGQIKQAVQQFFKVDVVKVRTINLQGKRRRVGRYRTLTKKLPDRKKAIVQLKPGQKIPLFEAGSQKQP